MNYRLKNENVTPYFIRFCSIDIEYEINEKMYFYSNF